MPYKAFVGIDVSRNTLDVAILFPELKRSIHRKVGNDPCGHAQILSWVKEQCNDEKEHVLICLEHTGIYCNLLCKFLRDNEMHFSVQSALHVKQSLGIRRNKNDKTDSESLARFAYLHHKEIEVTNLPTQTLEHLKHLVSFRNRLLKCKMVLAVPAKELARFSDKEVHIEVLRGTNQNIEEIEKRFEWVEKQILDVLKTEPKLKKLYDLCISVPGIGPQIAINTIIYTKGFTAFSDWRKFACFCGVAPFEHSSGTSIKGKMKVSKLGNRHLKHLLSQGAVVAAHFDKEISKFYEQKLKEGKPKMVVINIIRNKLISRMFSVVKRGTPYVKLPNF